MLCPWRRGTSAGPVWPVAVSPALIGCTPHSPISHAADLSEAAGSVEAEPQNQEGSGSAAGRLHHQKTVSVRLEENTGEEHVSGGGSQPNGGWMELTYDVFSGKCCRKTIRIRSLRPACSCHQHICGEKWREEEERQQVCIYVYVVTPVCLPVCLPACLTVFLPTGPRRWTGSLPSDCLACWSCCFHGYCVRSSACWLFTPSPWCPGPSCPST